MRYKRSILRRGRRLKAASITHWTRGAIRRSGKPCACDATLLDGSIAADRAYFRCWWPTADHRLCVRPISRSGSPFLCSPREQPLRGPWVGDAIAFDPGALGVEHRMLGTLELFGV